MCDSDVQLVVNIIEYNIPYKWAIWQIDLFNSLSSWQGSVLRTLGAHLWTHVILNYENFTKQKRDNPWEQGILAVNMSKMIVLMFEKNEGKKD